MLVRRKSALSPRGIRDTFQSSSNKTRVTLVFSKLALKCDFPWKYNIFGKMCPVPLGIQNAKKTQKTTNFVQKRVLNTFWLLPALGKTPKCHIWTQRAVPLGDLTGLVPKVTQTAPFLPISTGPPGQKNPAAGKWGHLFSPLGANWLRGI